MHTFRALAVRASALVPLLVLGFVACSDRDVAAPPDEPSVAIATASPSLAIVAGAHASITVRVTRPAGFAGPVTFGVAGFPAGITIALTPNPVTGDTAVLAVDAATAAAAGSYPLILSASGEGVRTGTAALELRVSAQAVTTVTVPFCAARAPIWAAFRDGDGPWTRAAVATTGSRTILRHDFASRRGAIATVTPLFGGQFTLLRVLHGAPEELATEADTLPADCEDQASRTWRGRVDALGADDKALVSTGVLRSASALPTESDFELLGVSPGPQDVLATRTRLTDGIESVTGFILRRDVDVPDLAQLPAFDFASGEAFPAATATLSIVGAGADPVVSVTELQTRNSRLAMPFLSRDPFATTRPYVAVPLSYLQAGDLQLLHLATSAAGGEGRTADVFFRTAIDRTLVLGAPITAPTLGIEAGGSSLRPRALLGAQSDYDQSANLVLAQAGERAILSIIATASYAPVPGSGFELVVPELSSVDGFDGAWALRPGTNVQWVAIRTGGTLPFGRHVTPTDGAERRTALVQGTLAAP